MVAALELNAQGEANMAYVGETPWHRLGTVVDESSAYDAEGFIKAAGLDWEAEKVRLQTCDTAEAVDAYMVRRTSDKKKLADSVGSRYTILQNRDAFKWFQPWLDEKAAALHTAGALFEGSRIWILAKLNRDPMEICAGDVVEKYVLLSHSHDGTSSIRCGFTPIRVVCWNTLSMAHRTDASKLIRVKHSKNVIANLENIRETMNLVDAEFEATAEQYRMLASKSINQADLKKYIKMVFSLDGVDDKDVSTRSKNIMDEVIGLCEAGKGNNLPSVRGTYWSAYNGVTEYLSYVSGRNESNRMDSLWFGKANGTNANALAYAVQMALAV
jgi:phage/plasmid-like protein (TIGR03299 family)